MSDYYVRLHLCGSGVLPFPSSAQTIIAAMYTFVVQIVTDDDPSALEGYHLA